MPRTERIFGQSDRDELLKALALARAPAASKRSPSFPAGRTVLRSGIDCLMADIDELGALLTGDPDHFKGKSTNPS
jgi:hypothetical protein